MLDPAEAWHEENVAPHIAAAVDATTTATSKALDAGAKFVGAREFNANAYSNRPPTIPHAVSVAHPAHANNNFDGARVPKPKDASRVKYVEHARPVAPWEAPATDVVWREPEPVDDGKPWDRL